MSPWGCRKLTPRPSNLEPLGPGTGFRWGLSHQPSLVSGRGLPHTIGFQATTHFRRLQCPLGSVTEAEGHACPKSMLLLRLLVLSAYPCAVPLAKFWPGSAHMGWDPLPAEAALVWSWRSLFAALPPPCSGFPVPAASLSYMSSPVTWVGKEVREGGSHHLI